jgi:hypothetical protein
MDTWHGAFLGLCELPPEISAFELQAFFTFSGAERAAIEERRHPAHKLGLALHIGFLRMSGRPLDAVRIVPANLWQHLDSARDRRPGSRCAHCITAVARSMTTNSSPASCSAFST